MNTKVLLFLLLFLPFGLKKSTFSQSQGDTIRNTVFTCDPTQVGDSIEIVPDQDSLVIISTYQLLPPFQIGGEINGQFQNWLGYALDISKDGKRVAIGAPGLRGLIGLLGQVRVMEWNGNQWEQIGLDIAGKDVGEQAGISVAISDDGKRVAVGSQGTNNKTGSVQTYEWDGIKWNPIGTRLDGDNPSEIFGTSISMSSDGNILAVGSPLNNQNGRRSGLVRTFGWNGQDWVQLGNDITGVDSLEITGFSVSLSSDGRRLAIGSPDYVENSFSQIGYARVFEWNQTDWEQIGSTIFGVGSFDRLGFEVAMSGDGDHLALGMPRGGEIGLSPGRVQILEWDNSSNDWAAMGNDLIGDVPYSGFGGRISLSFDGDRIAVGAESFKIPGNLFRTGMVRVYQWNGAEWNALTNDIYGEMIRDNLGTAVALTPDGSRLAAGASFNTTGGERAGQVRIFDFFPPSLDTVRQIISTCNSGIIPPDTSFAPRVSLICDRMVIKYFLDTCANPPGLDLFKIAPNPFEESVKFLVSSSEFEESEIHIFNMLGQEVDRIRLEAFAGQISYEWAASNPKGMPLPSGIYFARRLLRGEYVGEALKMIRR
ncbi:MAG: T9SS type A sorting domain-containing protein [Bacteroidia bacterium]|nr:T9SS type A sorting domain-containing protein [Bacteroidia bacterium]